MNTSKQISQWRIVAASVCGTSHSKNQQLCQDAHHWQLLANNVLIIAAADGAGSAKLGKVGSMIAVETAIEHLSLQEITNDALANDDFLRHLLTDTMLVARQAIETEADAGNNQLHDLATTLILMIATPQIAAVAQVGDGLAVAKNSMGNLIALTIPSSGEYINETTFLTSPSALETAQVKLWREEIVNVGVLTDGLQMLALNMMVGEPHKPFFLPLFEFVANAEDRILAKEQLMKFLSSERITQRTDDDLTLVLGAFSNS
ncbi:protein phosphatase 2C domain-containing protein [Anabaena sp. UHCC 0187]|uniref:PP2C family serine/threonine-protein phosphatase n=1 Tax=Anabaena sp. UHCC 0187 TaxID=2590018 RepID=UPI00144535C1|nr:PP2C family serine/threonine-protein phosphatase [Anabaena sp. UHCC 0187]MDP5015799.1 protein phosphatase 2C domain-containing protein [Dolichospermum sp.]MTJ13026.1 protein phosphatase 2C domain-containing protein [Anabaena sp. UHCC 0187]